MIATSKIISLGALFGAMAVNGLINQLAINWYPLTWQLADGRWGAYLPSDLRSCMGARLLASTGDHTSSRHWARCAQTLWTTNALEGFEWRYWSLMAAAALTLLAALTFALVVRFGRPPFRVVRGRRLLKEAIDRCTRSNPPG